MLLYELNKFFCTIYKRYSLNARRNEPIFPLVFNGIQQKINWNFWKYIIQLLNLDNFGAPIESEGVESIFALQT